MNRAFTLIELMAVIILLAIIAAISFPFIQDSINESKENTCKDQKQTIEYAAKRWAAQNSTKLGNSTTVSIQKLKDEGYLSSDKRIENPIDNKEMTGSVTITYDSKYKQYKYNYPINCEIE